MNFNKDMTIKELIALDDRIAPLLMNEGMNCLGCSSAENETLAEAAAAHGMDPVLLERKLKLRLDMDL